MKLKQLSLCILVACGLAACGGSNSNDNAPTDPGAGTPPPPPPKPTETKPTVENNGLEVPVDPHRAAPKMEVEKNLTSEVEVAKQLVIDRTNRNAIAGYNGLGGSLNIVSSDTGAYSSIDWGKKATAANFSPTPSITNQANMAYNPGSTDKPDVLRFNSMYNYLKEQSTANTLNTNGGIHAAPAFTYAKGQDGNYYRVAPNGDSWDDLTSNSTFRAVAKGASKPDAFGPQANNIPMSALVFIPNVVAASKAGNGVKEGYTPTAGELGGLTLTSGAYGVNVLEPKNITNFNLNKGEVKYQNFTLADQTYDLVKNYNNNNIPLDFSHVAYANEVQYFPIKLNYNVVNNQGTGTLVDDEVVDKSADVGEMKLYNLPYSRSSVTINQAAVADADSPDAAVNNLFNFSTTNQNGHYEAFQVSGYQTPVIPQDGRADYVGKSYGLDSEGKINLRADFGVTRAGISGDVTERTTLGSLKRPLPSLHLGLINLVNTNGQFTASKGMQETSGAPDGVVSIGGRGQGLWAVALYGPNAEEAAGVIDLNIGTKVDPIFGTTEKYIDGPNGRGKQFEVFSAQRGTTIKDSLNPGVGVGK